MGSETVEIFGTIKKQTVMAILLDDGDIEKWIPTSQIDYDEPNSKGETTVEMPEWLAIDKGFV